jgi:hypothetical protein
MHVWCITCGCRCTIWCFGPVKTKANLYFKQNIVPLKPNVESHCYSHAAPKTIRLGKRAFT